MSFIRNCVKKREYKAYITQHISFYALFLPGVGEDRLHPGDSLGMLVHDAPLQTPLLGGPVYLVDGHITPGKGQDKLSICWNVRSERRKD